jgi:hypothetical protein
MPYLLLSQSNGAYEPRAGAKRKRVGSTRELGGAFSYIVFGSEFGRHLMIDWKTSFTIRFQPAVCSAGYWLRYW